MTDADLTLLTQRVAARLPDVSSLALTPDGADRLVWTGACTAPPLMGPTTGSAPLYDGTDAMAPMLAELIAGGTMSRLLPEIVLTEDTAITVGPHTLRIAEERTAFRQQPRTDGGYGERDAGEDLVKVEMALRAAPLDTLEIPGVALALLTSLRCARLGMARTDGGRWMEAQQNAPCGTGKAPVASEASANGAGAVPSLPSVLEAPTRAAPWDEEGYRMVEPRPESTDFGDHWFARHSDLDEDGIVTWDTQWTSGSADSEAEARAEADADLRMHGVAFSVSDASPADLVAWERAEQWAKSVIVGAEIYELMDHGDYAEALAVCERLIAEPDGGPLRHLLGALASVIRAEMPFDDATAEDAAEARGADRERARIAVWLRDEARRPPVLPPMPDGAQYALTLTAIANDVAEGRYLEALAEGIEDAPTQAYDDSLEPLTVPVGTSYLATADGIVALPDATPEDDAAWSRMALHGVDEAASSATIAEGMKNLERWLHYDADGFLAGHRALLYEAKWDGRIADGEALVQQLRELADSARDPELAERLRSHVVTSAAFLGPHDAEQADALLHPWQHDARKP
jgi:hypothetical protein